MKKIICLFFCCILISSCGNDEVSESATGLIVQERETFSIPTPSTWESIPESELVIPKSGEIALAFRSVSPKQGYINNLVVLKKSDTSISADSIIDSGIQSLEKGIKGYTLISNNEVEFADKQSGKIIIYTGKYSADTPETVFIQTARVCGNNSYYMTISLTEKLASYDRYEYILQNFKCI